MPKGNPKAITINSKNYYSTSEAAKELDLSWNKLRRYFVDNEEFVGDTKIFKMTEGHHNCGRSYKQNLNIEPINLDNIDFNRQYTLDEVAEVIYQKGLSDHLLGRARIQQIEKAALIKLKKIIEKDHPDIIDYIYR